MKLVVTADLHLSESEPERLEIFRWLLNQVIEENADGLLIGGDVFDSNHDFRVLKGEFLSTLKDLRTYFPIVTVPGNHDSGLTSRTFLGERTSILDDRNEKVTLSAEGQKVIITGRGYHPGENEEGNLRDVPEAPPTGTTSIFLTHGSLIDPEREYIFKGIDRQDEENEHLIFRRDFDDLNYDCVILGHWHGSSHFQGEKTDFLYPGSLLPTSKSELGEKFYWVLTLSDGGKFEFNRKPITADSSWYYRKESLFALPNYGKETPDRLHELLNEVPGDPSCYLIVEIRGFVSSKDELELKEKLDKVKNNFEGDFNDIQLDWNLVATEGFDEPLVSNFIKKIEELDKSDVNPGSFLSSNESRYLSIFRSLINDEFDEIKRRILEGSLQVFSDRLD
ncbi:MAG: metallophosphoesterase [Candidatus Bipolaricaulota bacterium]